MNHQTALSPGAEERFDTSDLVIIDVEPSIEPMPEVIVIPGLPNETRRKITRLVPRIIGEAKRFVHGWRWFTITKVEVKQRHDCVWCPDDANAAARIELAPNADLKVLWHEAFHSAFHDSPLHEGDDEKWGDAWCDAFRYFRDAEFKSKIDRYCEMSFDQARNAGDWNHDKSYAYPCSLIVKKCNKNYAQLRSLWFDLCDQRTKTGSDVLSSAFGYEVANGVPRKAGTL